ncbi:MAG: glycosyltransferase family 4 protein [Betaproteobacteria bacterium]
MAERIRVLHVMRPSEGGMRTHLTSLVERLDRDRFEVVVASPEDARIVECVERCCGKHELVAIPGDLAPHRDVAQALALARLIRRVQPEICHLHGFKAAALGRAAAHFLERTSGLSRWRGRARTPGREGRPAIVYTVHNSVLARTRGTLKGHLCSYLERALARVTDRVIAVSRALWDEYSSIPGLGSDKVRHVPNGVALDRFTGDKDGWPRTPERMARARNVLGCSPDTVLFGTVARLIPDKGVGVLLHALAHLRKWGLRPEVLVAGDGPARGDLEALAKALGVSDQVRFLGFVEDIVPFYAAIDGFVLPSLSEGMPLSLIEAMAAGVPVVASRTPGTEEVVGPGMGLLAAPGDYLALAACLKDLMLRPWEAGRMAERARTEAYQRFSIEGMVRATQEVYTEVMSERGKARR